MTLFIVMVDVDNGMERYSTTKHIFASNADNAKRFVGDYYRIRGDITHVIEVQPIIPHEGLML